MGLLDFLTGGGGGGGDIPDPVIEKLTPEEDKRLTDFVNFSKRSAKDLVASQNQGVDAAGASAWGVPDQQIGAGISSAVQQKYKNMAGQGIQRIKDQNLHQSEMLRAKNMGLGQNLMLAKRQMDIANYERLMKAYNDKMAARSRATGALFGGIGAVAGAIMGNAIAPGYGGYAGAAAGAQIGSGIGQGG